ncbi:MAG: sodium pump decarboxylase subunit gamma [Bacteroidetes bacterium 4572_77]|nr:MAG: sodium pump decarboxylase subunit gamma [Bacteroidetes bacterium 4572_77]
MNFTETLKQFADPNAIHTLSMSSRFFMSLFVTAMGMGITFAALILISFSTRFMSSVVLKGEVKKNNIKVVENVNKDVVALEATSEVAEEDDEELIAVISAAIAASLNTSIHNIVVTNIVRVNDNTPAWGIAGRHEIMNNRINIRR